MQTIAYTLPACSRVKPVAGACRIPSEVMTKGKEESSMVNCGKERQCGDYKVDNTCTCCPATGSHPVWVTLQNASSPQMITFSQMVHKNSSSHLWITICPSLWSQSFSQAHSCFFFQPLHLRSVCLCPASSRQLCRLFLQVECPLKLV